MHELMEAVQLGVRIGLADNDRMEAHALVVAIATTIGEVDDRLVVFAGAVGLERFARCHLGSMRACDACSRDSAVNVLVALAVSKRAPVGSLLERLLVVIGVESAVAREAVAELGLPEAVRQ